MLNNLGEYKDISIHALREESDAPSVADLTGLHTNFNPRSP